MDKTEVKRSEIVGKYLLDISKLTFASFILGGIMLAKLPHFLIIVLGFAVSVLAFVAGVTLATKNKDKKE